MEEATCISENNAFEDSSNEDLETSSVDEATDAFPLTPISEDVGWVSDIEDIEEEKKSTQEKLDEIAEMVR